MVDLEIKVKESGESLYLFPFSYYKDGYFKNRPIYINPEECKYYSLMLNSLDDVDSFARQIVFPKAFSFKKIWYLYLKRLLKSIEYSAKYAFKYLTLKHFLSDTAHYLKNGVILWASDFPNFFLFVKKQLFVTDPNRYTNTIYLVPSEKYLKKRFDEWMLDETYDNATPNIIYRKEKIKEWVKNEKGEGKEIGILASTNT